VQHYIAMDRKLSPSERLKAESESHRWYLESAEAWSTWSRRGAATPESERERHKAEAFLKRTGAISGQAVGDK
jgi:hypothetical protein